MQRTADGGHGAIGVAVPLAGGPCFELAGEVWGRLPGKRRIAGVACAVRPVATRAGRDPARRFALVIDTRAHAIRRAESSRRRRGQCRVIGHDLLSGIAAETTSDPFHLRMAAGAQGVELELAGGVAPVESGEPRREGAIPLTLRAMASGAGRTRARLAAAEGDRLACRLERVRRDFWCGTGRQNGDRGQNQEAGSRRHALPQAAGRGHGSIALALILAAAVSACKAPPDARHDNAAEAVARGRELVIAAGCAGCHAFPDIAWPSGRNGPSLVDFDGRGPIAGSLPNTPANLAAFVRDAPAAKPGSTMPAMPLSEAESRDVAAYLYGLADD